MNQPPAPHGRHLDAAPELIRVLVAHPLPERAAALSQQLTDAAIHCRCAPTLEEALRELEPAVDVVLAAESLSSCALEALTAAIRQQSLPAKLIALCRRPTLAKAVRALRTGASDLLAEPVDEVELAAAVVSAAEQARQQRRLLQELETLRQQAEQLEEAHTQVADHLDALCDELTDTCASLAEQVDELAQSAPDLRARLAGVLDVEAALRIVLEHVLNCIGPTNAAIFLPGDSGDFNLGAYVNYDCDKDSVDVLLDHLADVLAPAFAEENAVVQLRDAAEQRTWLDEDAAWLQAYPHLLVAACHDSDGDCLAVMALFRDATTPFGEQARDALVEIRDAFAARLAQIMRIHHRLAKTQNPQDPEWGGAADDEGGLAA